MKVSKNEMGGFFRIGTSPLLYLGDEEKEHGQYIFWMDKIPRQSDVLRYEKTKAVSKSSRIAEWLDSNQ
jgi:hypothetical protein